MFRRSSNVHVTNDGKSNATAGGVFTRVKTYTEMFDGHPELIKWEPQFEEEKISVELAMTMSKEELRSLLPDEPLGHVLLVKQLLGGARVMDLPTDAFRNAPARFIAAVSLKPDPAGTLLMYYEVTMVVAALWMTISFTMLFSVPQSCAFEATDGEPDHLNIPSEYCNNIMPVNILLF